MAVLALALAASACAPAQAGPDEADARPSVVATTTILADLAANVAGDRAVVRALIPPGADPHSYEPGLRAVRDIANADLALTNGLLLEPAPLVATVEHSTPESTPVVPVAENLARYGTELVSLVENVALDAVWLGLRVAGGGLSTTDYATLALTDVRGPGDVAAYITTTFGQPEALFNSADGLDSADEVVLPVGAHTHVSWAFSAPGVYELDVAEAAGAAATVTVAVGVDPATSTGINDPVVVDAGHVDITADGEVIELVLDTDHGAKQSLNPAAAVVAVPGTTLQPIPGDPAFRFLGRPGAETYLLPQAVLGRHVHGESDPHVWHDVTAAAAMVQVIRDELVRVDPAGAGEYQRNADAYLAELAQVDAYVRERIESIPAQHRHLVTTHHGYAYLGRAYGISIAGFVSPNPAVEPTPRDLIALTRTLENLRVPAVFLEPQLARQSSPLTETAKDLDIAVCPIRGDTLDDEAPTYAEFMKQNADSLARCLA